MRRFTLPQVFAFSLALLIVNGAYLAAFAHASIFYEANVLLHLGLGLVLAGAGYLPGAQQIHRREQQDRAD